MEPEIKSVLDLITSERGELSTAQLWFDIEIIRKTEVPFAGLPRSREELEKTLAALKSAGVIRGNDLGWLPVPESQRKQARPRQAVLWG